GKWLVGIVARTTILLGIAIENLHKCPAMGKANLIVILRHRRHVANHNHIVLGIGRMPDMDIHGIFMVAMVYPFKTFPFKLFGMQSRFLSIKSVQILDECLDSLVKLKLEKIPVEPCGKIPLAGLSKFVPLK